MPKFEIQLTLEKPAKKNGADRYEGRIDTTEIHPYIPQNVSRPDGRMPVSTMTMTLEY